MANCIKNIRLTTVRLNPAEAELWISVYPDRLVSSTRIRGNVVGPSCPYSSTVEVAYPLREHSREYEQSGTPQIVLRVVIPEPCLWDPQSPFLYRMNLALLDSGEVCEHRVIDYGAASFQLSPRGLRWNGRELDIRGMSREACDEEQARAFHAGGFNTLLVPVADENLWQLGNRFGLLILGRLRTPKDVAEKIDPLNHSSALGWVLHEEMLKHPVLEEVGPSFLTSGPRIVGLELTKPAAKPIPSGFSFVLCRGELLPSLAGVTLPRIVLANDEEMLNEAHIMGTIRDSG